MISSLVELAAGDATAIVAPDEGGMLLSLRVHDHELLIPRREGAGPVPTFGSFLVAPWVAELFLGHLEFRGRHVRIPPNKGRHAVHGLVSTGAWQAVSATATAASLIRELEPPWPFGGTVVQDIRLDAMGITLIAEIRAGDRAMPAALGWHPWFACPDPGLVRVGVHANSQLDLDDDLLPTGEQCPMSPESDLRNAPILGDRRIDTVFLGAASPALLALPELELRIHFDPAIDIVVVYTSPGAVCIEPWSAWPDAIRMSALGHSTGLQVLQPGESLRRWTRWEWSTPKSMDNGGGRWVPSSGRPLPSHWTKSPRRTPG